MKYIGPYIGYSLKSPIKNRLCLFSKSNRFEDKPLFILHSPFYGDLRNALLLNLDNIFCNFRPTTMIKMINSLTLLCLPIMVTWIVIS